MTDKKWNIEKYNYLNDLFEYNIDELIIGKRDRRLGKWVPTGKDSFPSSREEFENFLGFIDNNIPMEELKVLLKRLLEKLPNEHVLHNNYRSYLSKKRILKTNQFDIIMGSKPKKQKETPKKTMKELSEERIKECNDFLLQSDREKFEHVKEILGFDIKGDKSLKQGLIIFFLKLGDILSRDLISKVDIHGDPSTGKSYICEKVIELFPEENYMMFNQGSDKALLYDTELDGNIKFLFLKELTKDSNLIEMFKAFYDGDVSYKYTNFEEKRTETINKERMGLLTTYSFEYTQRDATDRAWVLIPDQSHSQTETIINHRLDRRGHRIDTDLEFLEIQKKTTFLKDVIRVLRDKEDMRVEIPYLDLIKPLFRKEHLRVRRDIDKIPDLIETITLFNQCNRKTLEVNGIIYVFSQFEDLKLAFDIALEYFIDTSQDLDEIAGEILDSMEFTEIVFNKDVMGTTSEKTCTYSLKDICEMINLNRTVHKQTIRRKLDALDANSYISIVGERGRGKALKYKKLKNKEDIGFTLNEDVRDTIDTLVENRFLYYSNLKETIKKERGKT